MGSRPGLIACLGIIFPEVRGQLFELHGEELKLMKVVSNDRYVAAVMAEAEATLARLTPQERGMTREGVANE